MGSYRTVPQDATVPILMQGYNPPLKTGYSPLQSEFFGYDSARVPLTGHHHHRLLLQEDDLVSPDLQTLHLSSEPIH